MGAEPINLRASCLVARAHACADGFDRIGAHFSADFTRNMAREIERGAPPALYEHWIGQQEERLREKIAEREIIHVRRA